jgi:hypothetical protein
MQMKKDQLIKRLSMLYRMELFNVFGLPFVYVLNSVVYKQSIGLNSIAAIILNGILLLEGSFFWFCIYRNVTKKPNHYFIPFFKIIKPINVLLIGVTIAIVVLQPFESTFDRAGTIAFLSLAILEYINYFEVQLMYDNKNDLQYLRNFKQLKKAKLKVLMNGS